MLVDYKEVLWEFVNDKYATILWIIYIVLWVYTILRVARDINNRTTNIRVKFLSLILVWAMWPIALPIYRLIRPVSYNYQKQTQTTSNEVPCSSCHHNNNTNNDFCIFCGTWIKTQCKECKSLYPSNYQYCFKCWAPNLWIK